MKSHMSVSYFWLSLVRNTCTAQTSSVVHQPATCENDVTKREIARDEQFLFLPHVFMQSSSNKNTVSHFL